jgi:hypothetical protein
VSRLHVRIAELEEDNVRLRHAHSTDTAAAEESRAYTDILQWVVSMKASDEKWADDHAFDKMLWLEVLQSGSAIKAMAGRLDKSETDRQQFMSQLSSAADTLEWSRGLHPHR